MKKLIVIDGTSCLYRAFHAIPEFTNSKGLTTNAVYGFTQTLRKLLKDLAPDYVAMTFDVKGATFREEVYEDYKADRPAMPDTLSPQIEHIKSVVHAFNIPIFEAEGFEADDFIGALVDRFKGGGLKTIVVTTDKDMMQLVVDDDVTLYDYAKAKEYKEADVVEKFGVAPAHITDLISLAGDKSDGIPGVKGIGLKTAAKLIGTYGSLEEIYSHIEDVTPKGVKAKLIAERKEAELSKHLATFNLDVDVDVDIESLELVEPDRDALESVLKEMEFGKLLAELVKTKTKECGGDIEILDTKDKLKGFLDNISGTSLVSIALERVDLEVSLAADGRIFGIALGGIALGATESLAFVPFKETLGSGLAEDEALDILKGLLEDSEVAKASDDAKGLYTYAQSKGIEVLGVTMDTSVASYLINPARSGGHVIKDVAFDYLSLAPIERGKDDDDITSIAKSAVSKVQLIEELTPILTQRLKDEELSELFFDMELPVARILASMELWGITVDGERLKALAIELAGELERLEARLYELAGYEFNIKSPKQLSELLFEKLGLKPIKKTKTGYSTDESVLIELSKQHELPRDIIEYRGLSKLKSTYVDSLLTLISPATGRVHTSFNQTITATGRLSSSNPNLQNIPVKGRFAGEVRRAFVAEDGFSFLSIDYSQIELRIVAHFSEDALLIDSFEKEEDIHTRTAGEVFDIMPGLVTSEMRRRAKAINFGIIYGMGAHGLSRELDVSMKEAKNYIDKYFERYSGVRAFLDRTIEEAAECGYTKTLFGRRRYIPELQAGSDRSLKFGERIAVNAPIQGTAADIVKAAMVKVDARLKEEGLGPSEVRMLLQIHDELIFEVSDGELDRVKELVCEEMERVVELKVPIKVNATVGGDWQKVE